MELIRSFKNCIIHISMQKVATILQFICSDQLNHTNCFDRLQKFLEIFQNHSQKQSPEVFHKKFFSNISRYSQEKTCVGVSFLIKLQAISPVTLLKHGFKRDSKTDICCDYRETPNLKNICEQLHWKFFCKNIFQIRTCMNECSECSPVV